MTFSQITGGLYNIPAAAIIGVGAVLFLGTGAFFGYQYYAGVNNSASFDPLTYYAEMKGTFEESETLIANGDRAAAQEKYAAFLASTSDPTEIEQTRLAMARNAMEMDIREGVKLYKEIAADELLNPQIRAAALEELGLLYVAGMTADGAALTEAVFEGEPYASMRFDSNEASYMQLFAYANDIHPRLLATAYLAKFTKDAGVLADAAALLNETPDQSPFKPLALVLVGVTEKAILDDAAVGEAHIEAGMALLESFKALAKENGGVEFPAPDGKGYLDADYLKVIAAEAESQETAE